MNGKIIFSGKFNSRRNLSINITNGKLVIGNNVFCNQNVSINCRGLITIGDNTIIGEDTKFYDHNHRFRPSTLIKDQGFKIKAICIGKNVWLGSNVIVLSGVTIGDNSVVSAGSIVYDDIPANMIFKNNKLAKIVEKGVE
ncbi:acyltransferase [Providencia rettgeri]|nr:acyltransferase [Providencia rettgeri]